MTSENQPGHGSSRAADEASGGISSRLRLLNSASRQLADCLDPTDICRIAAELIRQRLPVAAFAVTLDQTGSSVRTIYTTGNPNDQRAVGARNRVFARLTRGEAFGPSDSRDDLHGWLLGDGWRESKVALYFNLHAVGRVTGIMAVHLDHEPASIDAEKEFLESVANIMGAALEKANIYQELNESRSTWENTLDCISDLVLLTDAKGKLRWINQAASVHLFKGGSGWFEQSVSQISLLRPLAALYDPSRLSDQSVTEFASELPSMDSSKRRFRVRTRIIHSPTSGAHKVVHVLRPDNFQFPEQPMAQDNRPIPAPVAAPPEPAPSVGQAPAPKPGSTQTWSILLIDDEILLANALARALRVLGHRVHAYHYGRHVLDESPEVLRNADLAVVDMRLPDIEGLEVVRRLSLVNDHMRYVLTSGISVADEVLDDLDVPNVFLHKPFRLDDLSAAIGRLMK